MRVVQEVGGRLLAVLAIALFACATGGCAHNPPGPPKPNPCIGPASARPTMPCNCPGSTDPACAPFPADAKKPHKETAK